MLSCYCSFRIIYLLVSYYILCIFTESGYIILFFLADQFHAGFPSSRAYLKK